MSAQEPQNAPIYPVRIVVIGSSTAQGVGASVPDSAWVDRFRHYLQTIHPGNEVINLGVGGYSSYQLLPDGSGPFPARPVVDSEHNISKALSFRPHAVIVNLPSNDIVSGHNPHEQTENFKILVETARKAGAFVWMLTSQPRNLPPEQVTGQLQVRDSIRTTFGEFAIDVWTPLAGPDNFLLPQYDSGDGIHLNDAGHDVIFEQVVAKNIPEMLQRLALEVHTNAAALEVASQVSRSPMEWLSVWLRRLWK